MLVAGGMAYALKVQSPYLAIGIGAGAPVALQIMARGGLKG